MGTHENVVKVVPLGGEKYNIVWNSEPVAEFVAAARKVEVLKPLEDGTTLKTAITWTGMNLFENTVTVTVFYKNTPLFGDFEFHRNFKLNSVGAFELVWDGTATSNMMKSLTTPIKTDAKITFNEGDLQVGVEKTFNTKTFTLIFNTRPLKIALLPYFEV